MRRERGTGEDCMNVYKSMGVCGMGYKGKGAGTNVTKKGHGHGHGHGYG